MSLEHDSGLPVMEGEAGPPSITFASGGLSWTRVRTPRLLSRIGKLFFASGAISTIALLFESYDWVGLFGIFSSLAWPLFIVSYILSLTHSAFPASLEVSAAELVIVTPNRNRKAIPRSRITGALLVEREMYGGYAQTVEIELANGDLLTARLADPRSAQAVVRALGFGAGGRRVHASLAKPTRRLLHPLLGALIYIGVFASAMMLTDFSHGGEFTSVIYGLYPVITLGLYSLVRRLFRAPELTVGDDGELVKRRFRSRFVPRSEIGLVSAAGGTSLVIEHPNGGRTSVGGWLVDNARRSAIARVIDERAGPSAAGADRFAHYERAGRALSEWREHLARSMNEASYRANAATVDEAVAVLRSAQATPEQRVGAALALRVAGQPRERIRVAVEGAASDVVREALEAVAETDDDVRIEKALRRLT